MLLSHVEPDLPEPKIQTRFSALTRRSRAPSCRASPCCATFWASLRAPLRAFIAAAALAEPASARPRLTSRRPILRKRAALTPAPAVPAPGVSPRVRPTSKFKKAFIPRATSKATRFFNTGNRDPPEMLPGFYATRIYLHKFEPLSSARRHSRYSSAARHSSAAQPSSASSLAWRLSRSAPRLGSACRLRNWYGSSRRSYSSRSPVPYST